MDTEVVKAFNAELTSVYDSKPPLSKKKIQDISKAALKAKGYYKHVVFSVEKFLAKCKTEYKIPCLYVIDSIIRTSKHQLKEKDVFAARFLKNFSKTLADLLACAVADQPRVVRTLNLWGANGVFTEEQLAPFKQQCRDMGIDTDIERVERMVKGDDADMSRYGGAYGRTKEKDRKKHHHRRSAPDSPPHSSQGNHQNQSFEAASTTPPMPPPNQPTVPVLLPQPTFQIEKSVDMEPSDEVPPCGLSERRLLDMMLEANLDLSGAFKNDIVLLRKAHGLICRALDARIRSVGEKPEIKELLSSQFDYSDEEDDGNDNKKSKRSNVTQAMQEDMVNIARNLIEDPNVIAAFKRMHAERIVALNQIVQAQRSQPSTEPAAVPITSAAAIQAINLPKGLPAGLSLPANIPAGLPNLAGLPGVQGLPGLQNVTGIPSLNLAQLTAINQANTATQPNQALLNLLANNSLISKLGSISGLQFGNARPTPVSLAGGIDAAQLAKQQEFLKQLAAGGGSAGIGGVPAPQSGIGLLGAAPGQLLGPLPSGSVPIITDDNESDKDVRRKERKRSSSRDRSDRKRKRSRSRERKTEKVDRERRKLGLPAVQEGVTTIASKTLWFGRLPPSCSENDIRSAISNPGDIDRVNLIASRACAYATMVSRKTAYEVLQRCRNLEIQRKVVKVDWAKGTGMKDNDFAKYWDADRGVSLIPWSLLPANLERFCDGSYLDVESLPPDKRGLYTDSGTIVTGSQKEAGAAPSKTDTSSPSPPPSSMHASPIKSLVPDSPAVLAPVHPQAVPPPAPFPPFMAIPASLAGGPPFMAPPPQMVPPPGFPMRLPMPPAFPGGPPGIPGQMFGPPGGLMMPPPPTSMPMPPPTSMPQPAPMQSQMPPPPQMTPHPPASMPPPIPGVSGMPSGQMRPPGTGGPQMPGVGGPPGPPGVPPPGFSSPSRGGFGGGGSFRGGHGDFASSRGGFAGGRGGNGSAGFSGDRPPFGARDDANVTPLTRVDETASQRDGGRRPWNEKGERGGSRAQWNEGRDARERGSDVSRGRRRSDDRGERRSSRWGDSDDRGSGSRWEGRDRYRSERDSGRDRDRRDRSRDRDRDRDRDSDRRRERDRSDRGGDRSDRGDRGERGDRSDRGDRSERSRRDRSGDRDRDRHRTRERNSPRYDDAPPSHSHVGENVRNGSEEAMVTSTTDVESNTADKSSKHSEHCRAEESHEEKRIQREESPSKEVMTPPPTEV